jgi:pimeloyl-ACP methyl ester carboxylesterase
MSTRPCLAFACAHLTDERLYAPQLAVLGDAFDCRVFVFRDEDSVRGMAEKVLAGTPPRFTLIGLSLGGYAAFEVARLAPERLTRLALLDTRASTDNETQRAGRHADIEKVRAGGIDALIPELPSRWLLPAHAARADLLALMADMARSIGARGQLNQQRAMLDRPDSHADLERLHLPALVLCGEEDRATPVAEHEAMAARLADSRLEIVPQCGHLSTIEQPDAVNRLLSDWLAATG